MMASQEAEMIALLVMAVLTGALAARKTAAVPAGHLTSSKAEPTKQLLPVHVPPSHLVVAVADGAVGAPQTTAVWLRLATL